jgi:TolB-like protein/cytochrome c-type biogenesis protein CcmH/NrfG
MAEDQAATPQLTPGRDVFISYASQDKGVAESVCKALESAGLACWIAPRDVVPGESFAGAIVHAIDATKVTVLVLSEHAADSQHVLREVERATSKRHAVIAFRLDMTALPADFEYFLNTSQWLDASTIGVRRALPKLVEAVRGATSQSSAGPGDIPLRTVATRANKRWRSALIGAAALVLAIGAYVPVRRFFISKASTTLPAAASAEHAIGTSAPKVSEKSIAVLPFVDMSEKHDQEYFSDGLSEELIDHLAHIPDLKVIARTSSFAFKGKNEDMRSIAAKLGVANLLEGSVRKSGDELRITAQLIRATDAVHLWSQTYERKLNDIFKVQDEISTTVAKELNAALGEASMPIAAGTTNIAAYNLILQGNYFFERSGAGDTEKAITFYRQAAEVEPGNALAWARLGEAYVESGSEGHLSMEMAKSQAQAAIQQSLKLDPELPRAHYALGNMYRVLDLNWDAATAEYERAVALDARGDVTMQARFNSAALKAFKSGRVEDLIRILTQDIAQSPLDTANLYLLGAFQNAAGHLEDSVAAFRKLLELNPSYGGAHTSYAVTLLAMGRQADALVEVKKESDEETRLSVLPCIYWTIGRHGDSDAAMKSLEEHFGNIAAFEAAQNHACRAEVNLAFEWLERADRQREGELAIIKVDPWLRSLHGDPRFDALLRKLKLVE